MRKAVAKGVKFRNDTGGSQVGGRVHKSGNIDGRGQMENTVNRDQAVSCGRI